jgi:hypothetical protein
MRQVKPCEKHQKLKHKYHCKHEEVRYVMEQRAARRRAIIGA